MLADLERLKRAPHLVLSDRVQHRYPQFVCDIVEEIFTVSNPAPKPRLRSLVFGQGPQSRHPLAGSRSGRLDVVADARVTS